MIRHELKGGIGIGEASEQRSGRLDRLSQRPTHGIRNELRIDDYPLGRYVVQADSPLF